MKIQLETPGIIEVDYDLTANEKALEDALKNKGVILSPPYFNEEIFDDIGQSFLQRDFRFGSTSVWNSVEYSRLYKNPHEFEGEEDCSKIDMPYKKFVQYLNDPSKFSERIIFTDQPTDPMKFKDVFVYLDPDSGEIEVEIPYYLDEEQRGEKRREFERLIKSGEVSNERIIGTIADYFW